MISYMQNNQEKLVWAQKRLQGFKSKQKMNREHSNKSRNI